MKNTTNFKMVKLADIVIGNTNPRTEFDKSAINELAKSISVHGVIQNITLREGKKKGYELVCGERRYRASLIANLTEIPAVIRELTDDQVFELQITENLQRKDISPIEEAMAFNAIQKKKGLDIKQISVKFGKSEKYIATRLKLINLIPKFQEALFKGYINLQEALQVVLLCKEDQEALYEEASDNSLGDGKMEITDYDINQFLRVLKEAPFDTKDPKLIKTIGACAGCQFNTANNGLLFTDSGKEAKCMNGKCYEDKSAAAFNVRLKEALEDPAIEFLQQAYMTVAEKSVQDLVKGHKVYTSYTFDYSKGGKSPAYPTRAFVLEGSGKGSFVYGRIKKMDNGNTGNTSTAAAFKEATTKGKVSAKQINDEIARLKGKEKRSIELDSEKVALQVYEALAINDKFKNSQEPLSHTELVAAVQLVWEEGLGFDKDGYYKAAGLPFKGRFVDALKFCEALIGLSKEKLMTVLAITIRHAIIEKFNYMAGYTVKSAHVLNVEALLTQYDNAKVQSIKAEIKTKASERAEKMQKTIAKLSEMKSPPPKKK